MGVFTEKDNQITLPKAESLPTGAIQHFKRFSAGAGATQVKITESEVSIGNVASGSNYISWNGTTLTISASINTNYVKTSFPQFVQGTADRISTDITSNTEANIGLAYISNGITVDTITLRSGASIPTPGTVDIAIYSEDGQTKLIECTTASISATFTYYTTSITPVNLPAGNYYIAIVPNGATSVSFMGWKPSLDDDTYAVTGGKVVSGIMVVSAGTLPTTFNPVSDITFVQYRCPILRLDDL